MYSVSYVCAAYCHAEDVPCKQFTAVSGTFLFRVSVEKDKNIRSGRYGSDAILNRLYSRRQMTKVTIRTEQTTASIRWLQQIAAKGLYAQLSTLRLARMR